MELRVRERAASLSNLVRGEVVTDGCQAEFAQVIHYVAGPASKIGDCTISGSRQLGESCEPVPAIRIPIEIADKQRRVLFGHRVVGFLNFSRHLNTLPPRPKSICRIARSRASKRSRTCLITSRLAFLRGPLMCVGPIDAFRASDVLIDAQVSVMASTSAIDREGR